MALSRLQRGLAHETRSILGSISIQLDLIEEILDREAETGPVPGARLRGPLQRARRGCERVAENVERVLGATTTPQRDGAPADLAALVRELQALIAPTALERKVGWTVVAPDGPVAVAGQTDEIRETLTIAAVELLDALPDGGTLEARLEVAGDSVRLRLASAPAGPDAAAWAEVVRIATETLPGRVEADGPAGRLEWTVATLKASRRDGHAVRADR
jgi:signal transduction histidine kinase